MIQSSEINFEKLKQEQRKLAQNVVLRDEITKLNLIAATDQIVTEDNIISEIVVMDYKTFAVVEKKYTIKEVAMPYVPGFLAYRELPAILETYNKLEHKPDLILVDGNGVLHPRTCGLASHLGVVLDIPTIGIAKGLLCGNVIGDTVYIDKEAVGKALETKEKAKPIYVSVGHKVTLTRALEIIKYCMRNHKLPEPLHLAHKLAAKIKRRLQGEKGGKDSINEFMEKYQSSR